MCPDKWLDVGALFRRKVNYVLGRMYLEISENNTKSRKDFQAQMQSDWTLRTKGYIVPEIKRSEIGPLIAEVWGQETGGRRSIARDIFFVFNSF